MGPNTYPEGMTADVMTFDAALDDSEKYSSPRNVLLGNGFSIDWRYETFAYRSLFDDATFSGLHVGKDELFGQLSTHDFEVVIESLSTAAELADLYGTEDPYIADRFREDAQHIRNGLADVLAQRHPNRAQELTFEEVEHARAFLSNFRNIFTVNYDLLLYWVVNRIEAGHPGVSKRDGFEWLTGDGPFDLIWKSKPTQGSQLIFYLHGALHYFRATTDRKLHKLAYSISEPLIDQVRERIEGGEYPRIVTEGRSDEKVAAIERNPYLRHAHDHLRRASGVLFIHGMSLSPNDRHILKLVESPDSEIEALYISVFGDPGDDANEEMMVRARRIPRRRVAEGGPALEIAFYDASSASVWR